MNLRFANVFTVYMEKTHRNPIISGKGAGGRGGWHDEQGQVNLKWHYTFNLLLYALSLIVQESGVLKIVHFNLAMSKLVFLLLYWEAGSKVQLDIFDTLVFPKHISHLTYQQVENLLC